MVNRKEDQGQEAIDKIKEEAGSDAKIEWVPCDMGNLAQIREVASRFVEKEERLDLVSRVPYPGDKI
jgi:NAD(P)-dependent dehydrogenase (short-subunit alcohol dehydrogenase family)